MPGSDSMSGAGRQAPLLPWTVRDRLLLCDLVQKYGNQSWPVISRHMRSDTASFDNPDDWYSARQCATQYNSIIEKGDTPRRQRRNEAAIESPEVKLARQLREQRTHELKRQLEDDQKTYNALTKDLIRADSIPEPELQPLLTGLEAWKKRHDEQEMRLARTHRSRRGSYRSSRSQPGSPLATPAKGSTSISAGSTPLRQSSSARGSTASTPLTRSSPTARQQATGAAAAAAAKFTFPPTPTTAAASGGGGGGGGADTAQQARGQQKREAAARKAALEGKTFTHTAGEEEDGGAGVEGKDMEVERDGEPGAVKGPAAEKAKDEKMDERGEGEEEVAQQKEDAHKQEEGHQKQSASTEVKEEPQQQPHPEQEEKGHGEEEKAMETAEEKAEAASTPAQATPQAAATTTTTTEGVGEVEETKESGQEEEEAEDVSPPPSPGTPRPLRRSTRDRAASDRSSKHEEESSRQSSLRSSRRSSVDARAASPKTPRGSRAESPKMKEEPSEAGSPLSSVETPSASGRATPTTGRRSRRGRAGRRGRGGRRKTRLAQVSTPTAEDAEADDQHTPAKPRAINVEELDDDEPLAPPSTRRRGSRKPELPKQIFGHTLELVTPVTHEFKEKWEIEDLPAEEVESLQRGWRHAIMNVWRQIAGHKDANLFRRAVRADQAPGYYDIVKRPMDLGTIEQMIKNKEITTTRGFENALMLMLANAAMFNTEDHFVHESAQKMKTDSIAAIESFKQACLAVITDDSERPTRGRRKKGEDDDSGTPTPKRTRASRA